MNVVRVVVADTNLSRTKEFKGKTYGTQAAAIYNGGSFPMPFGVNVAQGGEYAPGEYTICPTSFQRDDFGNLKLKSVKLLPLGGSSAPVRK
jgi:hypothetical protein